MEFSLTATFLAAKPLTGEPLKCVDGPHGIRSRVTRYPNFKAGNDGVNVSVIFDCATVASFAEVLFDAILMFAEAAIGEGVKQQEIFTEAKVEVRTGKADTSRREIVDHMKRVFPVNVNLPDLAAKVFTAAEIMVKSAGTSRERTLVA